ncbi:hypothetical protein BGW37DRAFT_493261 [Umbelopsis sp. PMI_123]|nr:hypothetical protein BGW37DRAFT_493261 [Umbelopsis sp. PMI_123]
MKLVHFWIVSDFCFWFANTFTHSTAYLEINQWRKSLLDRIDTPPLDIPSSKQSQSEYDTDYLDTPRRGSSLYLQAAPGSSVSVHSQSSPVPSPMHSESRLSHRHSGTSSRAQSPSSCVCFRCKNSSRPSSISSSYDQSLTCACYKCEQAKQMEKGDRGSRSSSFSHSEHLSTQPNMTPRRQSLYQWDDDAIARLQSPIASTLDQIQHELRYGEPSSLLTKSNSYNSYEDPDDAAEGLNLDEDVELEFSTPIRGQTPPLSLVDPIRRFSEALTAPSVDDEDSILIVADERHSNPRQNQQQQQPQQPRHSMANIPQPNIIPNRLSCLTAYYRTGPPHKALNIHQIKKIPQRRDRMNQYELGYFDCIQSRTELNGWLRKQEVKGPPDVMFEFSPPEKKQTKRGLFKGKIPKSLVTPDSGKLTNLKKNMSSLSLISPIPIDSAHRSTKLHTSSPNSPVKGKRWSGIFKGAPFSKKDDKVAQHQQIKTSAKQSTIYTSPNGSKASIEEEGISRRNAGHTRQLSEPSHNTKIENFRRRTSNEEFELASQFDQWQLRERGKTELRTPVEEEDEEEDEIAYFTPDGRLSSSPAKHQSPVFAASDSENTRHYSHSQISILSVPSNGNQPHGRSRRESESSHSHKSLQEHEYMDMEETLDNLASAFRSVDLEVLREMLEEADGDYQVAAARCKKAIFEGRL